MIQQIASSDGNNESLRKAASDAIAVQDAVNLIAVAGSFHRHLTAMRETGMSGDELNNHPVTICFASKISSLCRMTVDREANAIEAIEKLAVGEVVQYEVIPI
ncbi:hypothetical protein FYZ48_10900 [Gimesia chilikensis]|uniref:hypothetical protein n=1 Tax=Gimesia chilikensis TaxID=2605989 RepID=UPI0011EEFBF9|nr:hypothetical protein [Gimesia chilikensis]KAA0139144.1 hypothetical protein FYZ48_10900 [Gimesia chilikensis]